MTTDGRMEAGASLQRPLGFWLGWLGAASGALSAISAIERFAHVGLAGLSRDVVDFYRAALRPVHELVEALRLPFRVTPLAVDFAALYVVLLLMSWRASFMPFLATVSEYNRRLDLLGPDDPRPDLRSPWFQAPGRIAAWLLLWPVISLQPLRRYVMFRAEYRLHGGGVKGASDPVTTALAYRKWGMDLYRNASLQMFALPVAVLVFFVLNAFA